jgi:hypothetical protein
MRRQRLSDEKNVSLHIKTNDVILPILALSKKGNGRTGIHTSRSGFCLHHEQCVVMQRSHSLRYAALVGFDGTGGQLAVIRDVSALGDG